MAIGSTHEAWAVMWRCQNRMDGYRAWLLGSPDHQCRTLLFDTRAAAREFIAEKYGYIRTRPDLRREPHGWEMPMPVKVKIEVRLA